jgi:hypothetical protein
MRLDQHPVLVCTVEPGAVGFFLANSTFLRRVSHSSHALRVDNVRGSFNSSDVLRHYDGVANVPENFGRLLAIHAGNSWSENLERLVESTHSIVARGRRYEPDERERANILLAPSVAGRVSSSAGYQSRREALESGIQAKAAAILSLALVDNVNVRGNRIEQLITGRDDTRSVGDTRFALEEGIELHVEVKTKLLDRTSAPKAYNIDKLLQLYGSGTAAVSFCFVGIDLRSHGSSCGRCRCWMLSCWR